MTTYKSTYISAVVHRVGDNPIINEQSTTVTICDEAGGAFVSLTDNEGTTIKLDPEELEIVANVARGMLECFDDKMPKRLNEIEESSVEPRISFDDRWHKSARDLVAVIHRDGGHHAGKVGFVQACKDAESVVYQLMSDSCLATGDAQIVKCLFRYIDRMNDVCDEDPADTILREFVADVMPLIIERMRKRSDDNEAQKA